MDNRLILAVAGAGKTSFLLDKINTSERFLIVTYTIENYNSIRTAILSKFGFIPQKVYLYTYFQFLFHFCYKPIYSDKYNATGICFDRPHNNTLKYKRDNLAFILDNHRRLYHNRISFICKQSSDKIKNRIDKYFDYFFIDEVQDFAGHDFNLLLEIIPTNTSTLFVGDFYQHTFDTSCDGIVNKNLYKDYNKYKSKFNKSNIAIDDTTLSKTYRCSEEICQFIREKLGIQIYSHQTLGGTISFIRCPNLIKQIVEDNSIVKLFFKESNTYNCRSINWGKSKGLNCFNDVCVILNKETAKLFKQNKLSTLPPTTRSKLYVACTRPHGNLYFIEEQALSNYKK